MIIQENVKFYSLKAIGIATFFGGPIAAGYLVRQNYLAINEPEKAKKSLIIGIISTIILFSTIFLIPEEIMERIPNPIIPSIYTIIIYLIVEKLQGEYLKEHEENENPFHSNWKAAGIGLIFSIIIIVSILTTLYISIPKEYDIYDEKMETFYNNDIETDNFLSNIDKISIDEAIKSLNNEIVPKWNTNLEVLNNISQIENLPSELVEENRLLLEYSSLKLQSFEIIKKVIIFDNDKYNSELKAINLKKDSIIDLINKLE
tara:strand:+ start:1068 stop:1847 length:780 start_codon:yes stop_codon:yes gene_type:complete